MNLRRTSACAAAVTAALLFSGACGGGGGGADTVPEEKTFDLSGDRLVIDAPSAELDVVAGGGSDVRVQRWLSGTAAERGNASWTLDGDTLKLRAECSGLVVNCGRRFEVAIPENLTVVVRSGDGEYSVSGLSGPVTVEGGSGPVKASKLSGELKINTREGAITVSDAGSPTVRATSGNGDVSIDFATAPRLVDVKSRSGNITVKVPTAGQRYRVSVNSGTGNGGSKVPNDSQSANVVTLDSAEGDATLLSR